MGSISLPTALIAGSALSAGAGIAGGAISSGAASSAAQTQANAANQATALQSNIFSQNQKNLTPWITGGSAALNSLLALTGVTGAPQAGAGSAVPVSTGGNNATLVSGAASGQFSENNGLGPIVGFADDAQTQPIFASQAGLSPGQLPPSFATSNAIENASPLALTSGQPTAAAPTSTAPGTPLNGAAAPGLGVGSLTAPFQPTEQALESTPGYQFTLDQGLKALQNSYAAQGLGGSGAAIKGAEQYAQGLASTTFQQQFSNYLGQNQQIYNMLAGLSNTGLQGASALAGVGTAAGGQIGNTLTSGAAAEAAGQVGSANAISNALTGVTGNAGNTALLLGLNNQGLFGSGSTPLTNSPLSGASFTGIGADNISPD